METLMLLFIIGGILSILWLLFKYSIQKDVLIPTKLPTVVPPRREDDRPRSKAYMKRTVPIKPPPVVRKATISPVTATPASSDDMVTGMVLGYVASELLHSTGDMVRNLPEISSGGGGDFGGGGGQFIMGRQQFV